ncbi:glucosamine-6-phosphate deaminase [Silvibacterium acidisoli]|uniref:glucosamine-6-phosphate deaminase n=1 Tax=Acidobacteriaceae bacterium ZG23-2 TaxID=2883246 RepID=UPI00406D16C3
MSAENPTQSFKVEDLRVEIYPDAESLGKAAARAAREALLAIAQREHTISVIFATGASQLRTLDALTGMSDLPWKNVHGFHMDEYIGLPVTHPASFRKYLRENLTQKVPIGRFDEVDGNAADPAAFCAEFAAELKAASPQLCLMGIGENGHLAFNDPGVADFSDPEDVKVVPLDDACKEQQAAEGWFASISDVPSEAITITIPALIRVPRLIVSVPGPRKAAIVRHTLTGPITTQCPATILRTHPNATLYLDNDSAAELSDLNFTS